MDESNDKSAQGICWVVCDLIMNAYLKLNTMFKCERYDEMCIMARLCGEWRCKVITRRYGTKQKTQDGCNQIFDDSKLTLNFVSKKTRLAWWWWMCVSGLWMAREKRNPIRICVDVGALRSQCDSYCRRRNGLYMMLSEAKKRREPKPNLCQRVL